MVNLKIIKKYLLIILLLIACVLGLFFLILSSQFSSFTPNKNLKTYKNIRFGFSITYPKSWKEGYTATNGDGKVLLDEKPYNEIITYASYTPWSFSQQDDPIERGEIILNDGRKASFLKELKNGKISYIVFFNKTDEFNKAEVQYVLDVNVTDEFYNSNKRTLLDVAKSISVK
ncbi:MAG: hypothetical protein Q7T54_04930 [Candidatus Levybacteria bacterium]|nr:hypothetical protein [Candidatus Levybacteria bacterium]